MKIKSLFLVSILFAFLLQVGYGNPSGGTIVKGNATISNNGSTLTINQTTSRAIINWNSFNVANGELTNIIQPTAGGTGAGSAALLNRVTGGSASSILGNVHANGQFWLINPNGVVIGNTGSVNASAIVLSTLDLNNSAFMNNGVMTFNANPTTSGSVTVNNGAILNGSYFTELYGNSGTNQGVTNNGTVTGQSVDLISANQVNFDIFGYPQWINMGSSTTSGTVVNNGTINAYDSYLFGPHVLAGGTYNVSDLLTIAPRYLTIVNAPNNPANSLDTVTVQWLQNQGPISRYVQINPFLNLTVADLGSATVVIPGTLMLGNAQFEPGASRTTGTVTFLNPNNTLEANIGINFSGTGTLANLIAPPLGGIDIEVNPYSIGLVKLNNLTALNGDIIVSARDVEQFPGATITAHGGPVLLQGSTIGKNAPIQVNTDDSLYIYLANDWNAPGNQLANINSIGNTANMYIEAGGYATQGTANITNTGTLGNLYASLGTYGNVNVTNYGTISNVSVNALQNVTSFSLVSSTPLPNLNYNSNATMGGIFQVNAPDYNQLNLAVSASDFISVFTTTGKTAPGKYFLFNNAGDGLEQTNWDPSLLNFTIYH